MDTGEDHKAPPYMLVFVVLAVLTVLEVLFALAPGLSRVMVGTGLMVMALFKALLVALYYMHLRFEPKRLWLLVASPIPLIMILLVVVLKEY